MESSFVFKFFLFLKTIVSTFNFEVQTQTKFLITPLIATKFGQAILSNVLREKE